MAYSLGTRSADRAFGSWHLKLNDRQKLNTRFEYRQKLGAKHQMSLLKIPDVN